jgi:hypothetical protein
MRDDEEGYLLGGALADASNAIDKAMLHRDELLSYGG